MKTNISEPKPFYPVYDKRLQAIVVKVQDAETVYPCYWEDPDGGLYKIEKTRTGKVRMGK